MPTKLPRAPTTHSTSAAQHNTRRPVRRTSLVLVSRKRARVRFARPSMFIVPRKLVFIVLMGLYLCRGSRLSMQGACLEKACIVLLWHPHRAQESDALTRCVLHALRYC